MRRVSLPILIVALSLVAAACTGDGADGSVGEADPTITTVTSSTLSDPETTVASSASSDLDDLAFGEFLEASFELLLVRSPEFLTSLGVAAEYGLRNDRLDDLSPEYLAETQALEAAILERLRGFDRDSLAANDRTSYDVYEWYLDQKVRGHAFAYHDYPVHHFVNSYNFNLILFLSEEHPLDTVDDAEDYIARLSRIDEQVGQVLERLRISEEMGVMPPSVIVAWTSGTLQENLGGTRDPSAVRITRLPLYTAFEGRIDSIADLDEATRAELLGRVAAELESSFVPAWAALIDHMEQIRTEASPEAGVWRLPDGDAYYQWLLRDHTSTDLSAADIHQRGLEAVARVERELRAAFDRLGYPAEASLGELRSLAADEAGFMSGASAGGSEQIIGEYYRLIAGAEAAAGGFFGLWPAAEVGIVPEPAGRGGYYVAASVDGSRPGAFHAGVGGTIARYTMPTITYHETVPGHHTQIAIAQELDLPALRRYIRYNAFAEGWALYAERLAWEMGLYEDDPFGDIGRLELELLRAVRLVVDTGIHSLRWSRQEAKDYMDAKISGWSYEVERYMVLPGQATGYMIGMQTILDLRERAGEEGILDPAAFHDLILGGGSMPLAVLESALEAWVGG